MSTADTVRSAHGRPAPALPGTILVTGANGFIGRALSARLRELGTTVLGVDLVPNESLDIVAGDMLRTEGWASALEGVDAVIHTAAIVSNAASIDQAWTVNVLGTRRVLDACVAAGVTRFLHVSSVMAFGLDFPDGVDETYPARVCGHSYPDTRVNSEAVVLTAHAAHEIDCTIIRPGDVFGPGSVWVREPLKLIKARQMVLPDGGRGIFTPVYIDNLVDGILLALASDQAIGQVFTLTDGYSVTCAEYFGRLATLAGGSIRTLPTSIVVPLVSLVGAIQRRLGQHSELNAASLLMLARTGTYSNEKARTILGYQSLVGFDEGMTRVEAWARSEGLV